MANVIYNQIYSRTHHIFRLTKTMERKKKKMEKYRAHKHESTLKYL